MAISFVGASGANFAAFTGAASPGEPPGSQDDDILLNFIVTDTNHNTTGTPPTGWTKIAEIDSGTDTTMSVFWKRRSGAESNTWSSIFDANETGRAVTVGYRGCVASGDPLDVAAVTGTESGTAWDTGAITPVTNDCMLVAAFGCDPNSDPYMFAWDPDVTERVDSDTTGTTTGQNGTSSYVAIGDRILATPAATTLGGDCSVSDTPATIVLALKPVGTSTFEKAGAGIIGP